MRLVHEAQMHQENDYITLTYGGKPHPSLQYRHWQLFMRRLRKTLKPKKVRFYMAGEYGEYCRRCNLTSKKCTCEDYQPGPGRPHFHAIIFGHSFAGKSPIGKSPAGFQLWRSTQLEQLWPYGHVATGNVSFESCAYVARYIMKKINGDLAPAHYLHVDAETGEICTRQPEFNRMSLKPGIGATWWQKFKGDVYPEGKVVINGRLTSSPKYYDKLTEKCDPEVIEQLKYEREIKGRQNYQDNTDERLAVKEQVAIARTRLSRKTLT